MMKQAVGLLLATFALTLPCASSAGQIMFFPDQPPRAHLHAIRGTLTWYGIGQQMGNLKIRRGKREIDFKIGARLRIDGVLIDCNYGPPRDGYVPPRGTCLSWPHYVRIDKTRVEVAYWKMIEPNSGLPVLVTNAVTSY